MEGENWEEGGWDNDDYVVLPFWKKASSLDLSVSERSPAIAGSAYSTLDEIEAWKIICKHQRGAPELIE